MPSSVTNSPLRVLILGATGVFGSRLVERIALEPSVEIILSARNRDKLEALAAQHCPDAKIRTIDRDRITPADLGRADVVVDAAGPFQSSGVQVIDAALAAGAHYIDLADGRDVAVDPVRLPHGLATVAVGDDQAVAVGVHGVHVLSLIHI